MTALKYRLLALLLLTLSPAAALAQSTATGDWVITFTTPQGATSVNLSLKQDGEKLTGELNSPMGSVPVSGTLTAGVVALTASIDIQGTSLQLGMNGRVEDEALNGTVRFGDFGEFPFTGKRGPSTAVAPSAPAAAAAPPAAPAAGAVPPAADVSGTWDVKLALAGAGEIPVTLTLKQESDKVTGTMSGPPGEVPVTGTMSGKSLKLELTAPTPNGPIEITMSGDLGDSGFTGKASVAGLGEADWTGTRSVK